MVEPFLALTDPRWFAYLRSISNDGRLDEVNFWSPKAQTALKTMRPGEPVFFRLSDPYSIAGYGFHAHFCLLGLDEAWDLFGAKNGYPDKERFLRRIGADRRLDLLDPRSPRDPIGCTILRDAVFWPESRWITWDEAQGWQRNIVRGKTERDPVRASRLVSEISLDHLDPPEDLAPQFDLIDVDDRAVVLSRSVQRVGQGAFRARLLGAYEGRCAITGERTEPILAAAHVQPYLGPRSNHIQNGLLLTQEFHTLFDLGFVTVTPDHRVRVSPLLRSRWRNGGRFYERDGQELKQRPVERSEWPSERALRWHGEHVFEKAFWR